MQSRDEQISLGAAMIAIAVVAVFIVVTWALREEPLVADPPFVLPKEPLVADPAYVPPTRIQEDFSGAILIAPSDAN
jgi:hypothetical protein